MPCPHKFQQDLALTQLNFEPTTLIVGTFNPAWPTANSAQWFYGRTVNANGQRGNNFWAVLPRIYGESSLIEAGPAVWKSFCRRHHIAITDLISCIKDATLGDRKHEKILKSYSDKGITTTFSNYQSNKLGDLLTAHPTITHVYLTRAADSTFWKTLWQPAVDTLNTNARTLLTPSGYARYQKPKDNLQSLEDFILERWQYVWHPLNH